MLASSWILLDLSAGPRPFTTLKFRQLPYKSLSARTVKYAAKERTFSRTASEDEVALDSSLVSVLEDWRKRSVPTPEGWLFANEGTKRPVHGDVIQKDYLRPAGEKIGLQGVGWRAFRHTYRPLIDDVGTPLGAQQRLMRHADIKTTMNTYGSAFKKSKRRANSLVAALVLPPAIKKQLKDKAKEFSLKNLRPETAANQAQGVVSVGATTVH
jgi:integrase